MAGMSITPSRQKEIILLPYQGEATQSYALIYWKRKPVAMRDLSGKTIAVMSGTWMEDYLKTEKNIIPKVLESNSELVMDIQYGKSDAAFVEPYIARDIITKHPEIRMIELPLPKSAWVLGNGIGIKKSNIKLAQEIQTALDNIKKSGLTLELEKKWLHKK